LLQRRHRSRAPVRRLDAGQGRDAEHERGPRPGEQAPAAGRPAHDRQRPQPPERPLLQLPAVRPGEGRAQQAQSQAPPRSPAGDARYVHVSHYGRICPIEAPEGPNIGLIGSLATYGRVNPYGFIESPYRRIVKDGGGTPRVSDEIVYLTADEQELATVVQANASLDDKGFFVDER